MEILKWAILTIFFMSVTVGLGVLFFPRFSGQSPKQIIQDIAAQADIQINGTRPWDIRVHNEEFYTRVLRDGSLGFGEAYQEKMWDCDALDVCFTKLIRANLDQHVANSWTMVWAAAKAKLFNLQTKKKAWRLLINIIK
nr:hypothetical protein [Parachlamydia acanthamoebae]